MTRLRPLALIAACLAALLASPAHAQEAAATPPESTIATKTAATESRDIAERIRSIYSEIEALRGVQVRVSAGVVTLSGTVPGADDVKRGRGDRRRACAGVVTVQNDLEAQPRR